MSYLRIIFAACLSLPDLFWWHTSLKDDDLAGRMGLQPKELNKVIATLSNDRLVQM
jgi:transcription initiation factor IIE alpha subunit